MHAVNSIGRWSTTLAKSTSLQSAVTMKVLSVASIVGNGKIASPTSSHYDTCHIVLAGVLAAQGSQSGIDSDT